MDERYRFAPATPTETTVYGSSAPGFGALDPAATIDDWIAFVDGRGVDRVCCLLTRDQLEPYGDLIGQYGAAFGRDRVLHAPVTDHHLVPRETLEETVLPFLEAADETGEPVVVHCLAGIGRTGIVLSAWLVHARGFDPASAVKTVSENGRRPDDAIRAGNATEAELAALLDYVARNRSE